MRLIVLLVVLLSAPAWGASVYKCVDAEGAPVYSQLPCGNDAVEVDTSAALKTGTGGHVQGVSDMAAMGKIDHECNRESLALAVRFKSRRDSIEREIRSTRSLIYRTSNNLAGASLQSGLENKVAQLQGTMQVINSEEAAEGDRLRERCDERREAERERQRERDSNP